MGMSELTGWEIREIEPKVATEVVVKNHYLHRRGPCSKAFGLFDTDGVMRGVITYGVPASVPLVKGVLGAENRHMVGELTRLWIDDDAPRNGESFLIGNTIRKSGFDVIVSFADSSQGHIGTVYQATNWIYTGLSSRHKDWVLIGHEGRHTRHTWDQWGGIEGAKKQVPHLMTQVERPRKHRYIFINAKGGRRNRLLRLLRYPVEPYPKVAPSD
ncbi:hypothetical protein LUPINE_77 [Microbacterium phage Lupine]|nr:hypothetical protein LUPINE_77 [Microbacterium phage Lupine]